MLHFQPKTSNFAKLTPRPALSGRPQLQELAANMPGEKKSESRAERSAHHVWIEYVTKV